MKYTYILIASAFVILLLLFPLFIHAQSQAPTTSTVTFQSNDHPAVFGTEAPSRSLLSGGETSAHGEQPLAQYGTRMFEPYLEDNPTFSPKVPLGDVARYYRRRKEEHDASQTKSIR